MKLAKNRFGRLGLLIQTMVFTILLLGMVLFPLFGYTATQAQSSQVIITGILDGTLTGGVPKAIELYIIGTVDMSNYTLWRSSNGGSFSDTGAALSGTYTDEFVYLIGSDESAFNSVFGTSGDYANRAYVGSAISGNGDDAFQIRDSGGAIVIDQVWYENTSDSYRDSYWYRNNETGPDGGWVASNWTAGGNDALDGMTAAQIRAAVPFGTYQPLTPSASGLTITKTAYPPLVNHGDTVTYTIALSSTAAFSDTGAMMTDTLPISAAFSHWVISQTGTIRNGDAITWTGQIATNTLTTFTFVATHTGGYDEVVTNTAYFSGTTLKASDAATFTVPSAVSDLSISKIGPAYAIAGEQIVYTITVQNTGGADATGVALTDTLPVSVTYLSDNSGWLTQTVSGGVKLMTGTLASGAAQTFNLTATVDVSVTNGTRITNTVFITNTIADDNPVDNSDQITTTVYALVPIATARAGNDGDIFMVEGKIIYTPGTYNSAGWGVQDSSGGIGAYYYPYPAVNLGDTIRILGTRGNFHNEEQFTSTLSFANFGSGAPVAPTPYSAANIDNGSSEGWLAIVTGTVSSLSGCSSNYSFSVDDGSGAATIYVDRDTGVDVCAMGVQNGDTLVVAGFSTEFDGNYQLKPRFPADVKRITNAPTISKNAPAAVNAASVFTYTITVENSLGYALNNLVLTDTVPVSVTFISASDGGTMSNGVVSWSIASLADGASITRTFRVTAPTQGGVSVSNNNYAVRASNYSTPTFGSAVTTTIQTVGICGQPYTPIYQIQGSGSASSMDGDVVTTEGVVTSVYDGLRGFFIQDPVGDGDSATSDGIFIYYPSAPPVEGDVVLVTGEVDEYYNQTELTNVSSVIACNTGSVSAVQVTMPFASADDMEKYEGMLVTFPQTLYATENYNLARYGQFELSSGGRLMNPTNMVAPGQAANDYQAANNLNNIWLDDGSSQENPDPIIHPMPTGLTSTTTMRAGYSINNLTGVVYYGHNKYFIEPIPAAPPVFTTTTNPRTNAPEDVGGTLKVASFNVLNYFTTIDDGVNDARGADSAAEFTRQRTKIITAMLTMNADIIGLMEIENNGYGAGSAIQDLVDGLNANGGTYAFIDPGTPTLGNDAIAVGLIYNTATVSPTGAAAVLDSSADPNFNDDKNRPALAQTFMEKSSGEKLTVAVNHLKSKGSSCSSIGDPDTGDGQGNCNLTRTSAMTAEVSWLAGDPTNSGDPDFLIIGDLNSYAMEDPVTVAKNAGYTDLLNHFVGPNAYTYIYYGQSGYLDHSLANASLFSQVVSATVWHINADEPRALDYNDDIADTSTGYSDILNLGYLYSPTPYRASDHDPVIVGLNLSTTPQLNINKTVVGSGDGAGGTMNLPGGKVVTYTIVVANSGSGAASNLRITDTLPAEVAFESWVTQGSAVLPSNGAQITWGPWDLAVGEAVTISFRATVTSSSAYAGKTVTNTAEFSANNAEPGSDEATFSIKTGNVIYLPLVMKQ